MSPVAILATTGQLMVALEILRAGPADPQYVWALGFLRTDATNALAAIRDPRERTRLATATRQARAMARRRRAVELRDQGLTIAAVVDRMSGEEDRTFDETTIRRWIRQAKAAGISSA